MTAAELVSQYNLLPHPEGGWYKENYRSNEIVHGNALPSRFSGDRAFSTAIYFLLETGNFSAFHRIKSDECWHFYAGDPLDLYIIHENGTLEHVIIGNHLDNNEHFQYVVPAGCWFASRPAKESAFSFLGCTVSPGFDFQDFELADKARLISWFPQHASLIESLCIS